MIINHAPFGRYAEREFVVDGIGYICLEQYRVAEKARMAGHEDIRRLVIRATDPLVYTALDDRIVCEEWASREIGVLFVGILKQLAQHKDMYDALMNTRNKELTEIGYQLIGIIFMRVRKILSPVEYTYDKLKKTIERL
jgi:predicted NAD-dependent protein-ADP-ribosyltransferase YbiA (DUF1768 family)